MKLIELGLAKLETHLIKLFHANAMFAGNRATHGNTIFKDFSAKCFSPLKLALFIRIVQNQGMKVAVPGMKNVSNRQLINRRQPCYFGQYPSDRMAWDRTIHAVVVWRESSHRGKGRLPALPKEFALFLGSSRTDIDCPFSLHDVGNAICVGLNLARAPIQFT